MHILLLPSWYPSADNPVNGSFFVEQAEALADAGHTVSVVALYQDGDSAPQTEIRRRGNLTEYLVHYKDLPLHMTFLRVTAALRGIFRREFKNNRPDITHVHVYQRLPYAQWIRRLYGIPYVVTEHVTWFERGIVSARDRKIASRGYRAADAVLTVSPGLRDTIRPLCGDREITVVPNLVSPRFFEGELRTPPGDRFGFISIGTLEHKKGMDLLLRSFADLASESERYTLTVCGTGPDEEALKALAAELGAADRVTFTGRISREEVAARLRENQCFVLPSRSETFGVVFIEAMACGMPIVMTKTNAWQMLALPDTGLAVEIDDREGLTRAMRYVPAHYERYDPEKIREYCVSRFSASGVARQLTEIYEKVLGR